MATHKQMVKAIQKELDKLADKYAKECINKAIDKRRQEDDGAWLDDFERQERQEREVEENAYLTLIAEEEQILFGNTNSGERQRS